VQIVKDGVLISKLKAMAQSKFGDLVKAVVDVGQEVMALDAELHADEEALLIKNGSKQQDLWGINIYPDLDRSQWIEYDSMINLKPAQGNRTRGVDQPEIRERIVKIVNKLVKS